MCGRAECFDRASCVDGDQEVCLFGVYPTDGGPMSLFVCWVSGFVGAWDSASPIVGELLDKNKKMFDRNADTQCFKITFKLNPFFASIFVFGNFLITIDGNVPVCVQIMNDSVRFC